MRQHTNAPMRQHANTLILVQGIAVTQSVFNFHSLCDFFPEIDEADPFGVNLPSRELLLEKAFIFVVDLKKLLYFKATACRSWFLNT
jgi:hypothetical protein